MSNQSIPDPADAVYSHEVPAERPWSRLLKRGQTLRIVDIEGQQAVDALLYCAEDLAERYSAQDTMRVQGSAYVELGTRLVSNKGRIMARITADTCGRHDTSAGCCSCESNAVRFGESTKYQHACRENFILELSRYGLAKRDIVANLNFFMNVPIDPSGNFTVVDGISAGGNHVDITADMDVIFVISNCPQVNNPCNGFNPTPVRCSSGIRPRHDVRHAPARTKCSLRARPQTVSCSWRKAASSRPEELMGNPRNERTRSFLRMVMGKA